MIKDNIHTNDIGSFAIIRAGDTARLVTSICDLVRYAQLKFVGKAKKIEPTFADNILIDIIENPLRTSCKIACIIPLYEDAKTAIHKIRNIHPPGHIMIISPRYDIFHSLIDSLDTLPEIDTDIQWDIRSMKQNIQNIEMTKRGILITLESIDEVIKSNVVKSLETKFHDVIFTKEPICNWIEETIIESDIDPLAELFLFVADHAEHVASVIKPALFKGKIIISDRYSDSTYAYQSVMLSYLSNNIMRWIQDIYKAWTVVPDITIIFKTDPNIVVEQYYHKKNYTRFEKTEFLRKVQNNFLKLAEQKQNRFVIIDVNKPLEDIVTNVIKIIEEYIN